MKGVFKLALIWLLLAEVVSGSEQLEVLAKEDRQNWPAVGLVTSKGPDGAIACTGTLVAPDFVVTAAHCVSYKTGLMEGVRFIAGLDGTRRVATSSAVEVFRYPVWDYAAGVNRLRLDLAGLRLGRLIPKEKVTSVELFPKGSKLPETGALLGYGSGADAILQGRYNCGIKRLGTIGVLASDCGVSRGNSGGPLMVKTEGKWLLAGVIVASNRKSGTSTLVEVNDWMRTLVRDAQRRAMERAAAVD